MSPLLTIPVDKGVKEGDNIAEDHYHMSGDGHQGH